MSLALGASLIAVFPDADTNVVPQLQLRQRQHHHRLSLALHFVLQQSHHVSVASMTPFVLSLFFVDAVLDDESIISFHDDCSLLIFFLKTLGGS
jgi:hypothetical protein